MASGGDEVQQHTAGTLSAHHSRGIRRASLRRKGILRVGTALHSPSVAMMTSQEPQSVNLQPFSADERLQQVGIRGEARGLRERQWG